MGPVKKEATDLKEVQGRHPGWIPWLLVMAVLGIPGSLFAQGPQGSIEIAQGIDRTRTGGEVEERWNTRETYNLNLSQDISPTLTYNLLLSGTRTQDSAGNQTSELTPQLSSNGENAYYRSSWSYIQHEQRDPRGTRLFSTISSSNIAPKLPAFLPFLSLSRTTSRDRDSLSPHQVDATNRSWRLKTDYALPWMKGLRFSYDYNWNEIEDFTSGDEGESRRHQGRVTFGHTLFEKLSFNAGWGREANLASSSRPYLPTVAFFVAEGLSALNALPTLGVLDSDPGLVDGDLFSSTGLDLRTPDNNLGVDLGRDQTVGQLFVYTRRDFSDLPRQPRVLWEVYRSDEGTRWERVAANPATTFNLAARRYEISFPATRSRYLKVVNRTTADFPEEVGVTLHFDDRSIIVNNAAIRDLSDLGQVVGSQTARPVLMISFALNYHFGGLEVFGYHLVNLLLHIAVSLLVYRLAALLFLGRPAPPRSPAARPSLHTSPCWRPCSLPSILSIPSP